MQPAGSITEAELRKRPKAEDSNDPSPLSVVESSGPFERGAAALKVALLCLGPTALLGALFAAADIENPRTSVIATCGLFTTLIAGSSVLMRRLALDSSPFPDRAATALVLAPALGATAEFAIRMADDYVDPWFGVAMTVPWFGAPCLYWSLASPVLVRNGEGRTRTQWRLRDLALALLLFGFYAAAVRWLVAYAQLDDENFARMFPRWIASFAAIGLVPFAIDLACRCAARSRRRWIFATAAAVPVLAASLGSLGVIYATNGPEPIAAFVVFAIVSYIVLSATLAGLAEWRPVLPTLRRLDRRFARPRSSADADRMQEASRSSSSAEERRRWE